MLDELDEPDELGELDELGEPDEPGVAKLTGIDPAGQSLGICKREE